VTEKAIRQKVESVSGPRLEELEAAEEKEALFARDILDNHDAIVLCTDEPVVFRGPADLGEG
jgi:hypothetical protein